MVLYHRDFERDEKSKKFLKILNKLSKKEKFAGVKFFAINAEKNELKHFYHDEPPLLILYSKKDLLNPIYYEGEPEWKKVLKFVKSKKDLVKKRNVADFFTNEF